MKRLLIIGAGGHGRCCLDIARENKTYQEISFLDDNATCSMMNHAEVLGTVEDLSKYIGDYEDVFVAIGNNTLRKELISRAQELGYKVVSLVSSKAVVSEHAKIGTGTVLFPGVVVEANATIGEGCVVAANATINHDANLRSYTLINSNTVIRPKADIQELVSIGSRCVITFGKTIEEGTCVLDGQVI